MRLAARLARLEKHASVVLGYEPEDLLGLSALSEEELDRQIVGAVRLYEAEHGEIEPMAADRVVPHSQWSKLTNEEFIAMAKRDLIAGGLMTATGGRS